MHRRSVDLPLPDGPMMVSTSPAATSRSMSLRTWCRPKFLLRRHSRIIDRESASAMRQPPPRIAALHRPLQVVDEARGGKGNDEIEREADGIYREILVVDGGDGLGGEHHLGDAGDRAQRRVLEQRDEIVAEPRNDDADRLRQHDAPEG